MEFKTKVNIHNRFDVVVTDVRTGEVKKKATGYNIVLNQMWTRLCGGLTYFVNIHYGTGTGTLLASRTSLFTHKGTKTAVDEELIKALPVSSWKRKIVLNPEEEVGTTITELGIAFGATASNLVTHAMLKDSEGNVISITKTNTDVVTIYATVFVQFGIGNEDLKYINMPNANTLVNYLIGGGSAPTGSFGLLQKVGGYSRLGSTVNVTWTADVGNKQRKTDVPRFGVTTANGHARALEFTNLFRLGLPSTGIFAGQSYVGVPIGVGNGSNVSFALPSRNLKSGTLTVKLDGVETTAFSIDIQDDFFIDLMHPINAPANGVSISLSADGSVLALGSAGVSPHLKIWDWDGFSWTERSQPSNIPSNGYSVSLSADGSVLALGSSTTSPFVKVWDWNGSSWTERSQPPNIPANGNAVSLSADGSVLAMSSMNLVPYVKIWDWNGSSWTERSQPSNIPSNGYSVSLSTDGSVLALGSNVVSPYLKIWDWDGFSWTERSQPSNIPSTGNAVSLSADGSVLALGSGSTSPYLKIWDWNGSSWTERSQPSNIPSNGYSVVLSSNGSVVALGSNTTSPYLKIWNWNGSSWTERSQLPNIPSRCYTVSLSADGSVLAMGSYITAPYLKVWDDKDVTQASIVFNSPPANGAVITADYTVDGIHKTDQYVVDVSMVIQFGEPS
jgi:WD40 repeat protein